MTDPRAVMDLIRNPEKLRELFQAEPDANSPPAGDPYVIDIPEAAAVPGVECNVEVKLSVAFDPWQIGGIPHDELKAIVWSALTRDGQYVGGIVPDITFVSMTMERRTHVPSDRSVRNAPRSGAGGGSDPERTPRAGSGDPGGDGTGSD